MKIMQISRSGQYHLGICLRIPATESKPKSKYPDENEIKHKFE